LLRAELLQMSTIEPSEAPRWRHLDAALHAFFRTRVADPDLRADLVQDVLLRMHERREQLREHGRLEAWTYRIARNALIDHYRRHRGNEPLPELAEPEPESEPDDQTPRVLGTWLNNQIAELPPRYREALELTELRGLSQREAAKLLGVADSTFKSRVQRGRDLLHAELLRCCAVEVDARGHVMDFQPRTGPAGNDCGCTASTCNPSKRLVRRV
jgi:RNA polymerase sigma-70 factor (ECF subfamily)